MSTAFVDNRTRALDSEAALVESSAVDIGSVSAYLEPISEIEFNKYAIPDKVKSLQSATCDLIHLTRFDK